MDNDKEILIRLNNVTDKEWLDVIDKLTTFVHFKINGKTLFGAHSENNLGVNPISFYVNEAIGKLFSLEWKWQFEKFSLLEQLKRIVGSMISTNVEKFKAKKMKVSQMEDDKLTALIEKQSIESSDECYELFKEALEECSKDDEELQFYAMALEDCNSFDEMCETTGFEKKKLYSLQQKMTRRIKSYLETKKELTK